MLQTVATLISTLIASGALALIVGVIADDWKVVRRVIGLRSMDTIRSAPARSRPDRQARVVRVSAQSVPLRAAA